jgi:hypothetical protein
MYIYLSIYLYAEEEAAAGEQSGQVEGGRVCRHVQQLQRLQQLQQLQQPTASSGACVSYVLK